MEIRYCCPDKFQFGDCEGEGYEWTNYFNSDDATQDGDWELIKSFSPSDVCQNPIAVQGWVSFLEDCDVKYTVHESQIYLIFLYWC